MFLQEGIDDFVEAFAVEAGEVTAVDGADGDVQQALHTADVIRHVGMVAVCHQRAVIDDVSCDQGFCHLLP